MKTIADPVDGNPNHVNITNWPSAADKPAQKLIAQEIAAVARFVPTPESPASANSVTTWLGQGHGTEGASAGSGAVPYQLLR